MNIPDDPRGAFDVVQQARGDLTQRIIRAYGSPEEASLRAARTACRKFVDAAGHFGADFAANPEAFAQALASVRAATAGL